MDPISGTIPVSLWLWQNTIPLPLNRPRLIFMSSTAIHAVEQWDAQMWYSCMCSAEIGAGHTGNPAYPNVGPR